MQKPDHSYYLDNSKRLRLKHMGFKENENHECKLFLLLKFKSLSSK